MQRTALRAAADAERWASRTASDATPNMRPPLRRIGESLALAAGSVGGYLAGPTGDWILPAKPTSAVAGACLALLGVWARWTFVLWKANSQVESVKRAREEGRPVCHCTSNGVIMLHDRRQGSMALIYRCPNCGEVSVRQKER